VAGATVTVAGTPLSTSTAADGTYRLVVPYGSYDVRIAPVGSCTAGVSTHVQLTADASLAQALPVRADRFGHTCRPTSGGYLAGTQKLALSGDDSTLQIDTPFPVLLYGKPYDHATVSTNGVISFDSQPNAFGNGPIPEANQPNNSLYPFWDDLFVDDQAGVYTATVDDTFVVEWRNVRMYADVDQRLSFSAAIRRDGTVSYSYRDLTAGDLARGGSATIGLENADGTDALAYSINSPVVTAGSGVTFRPPDGSGTGVIEAELFDAQSGSRVEACQDTGGGQLVSGLANGDWLRYDAIDFGATPARQFAARVASGADGISGLVQVRLDKVDSPPVGDISVADTGGWQTWRTVPGSLTGVTGVHTVYLTFSSGQPADFVNVNWLLFKP
jgi:hypothetical protein